MYNLIKLELRKIKFAYLTSLCMGLLYSGLIVFVYTSGWSFNVNIQIWDMSVQVLCYIYPFFAVMPTCWLLYYERKNHFLAYTQNRVSKKQYILSKYLVSSIGGGGMIFFMSMIGLIISLYIIPQVKDFLNPIENVINAVFQGKYYVYHSFMYGFILSLWRFIIGFLIASLGFVLSLYLKNLFIIFTFPFVYTIGENIIFSLCGLHRYMLFTSFAPTYMDGKFISYYGLLIGPFVLIIAIITSIFYFSVIKKIKIFEI